MFAKLFQRAVPEPAPADSVYRRIVAAAREPVLYRHWGVPDSLDGRFEMLVLHAFLVMRRLKGEGDESARFSQALFDAMFADLDSVLREIGVSDIRIGTRIKQMVSAWYGRVSAYDSGLNGAAGALEAALRRNAFGTVTAADSAVAALAGYMRGQSAHLGEQPAADIAAGRIHFQRPASGAAAPGGADAGAPGACFAKHRRP